MHSLLNKSYEQLNTQELYILEDIIAQKRKVLEQGYVPSLRHLESLDISKYEALMQLFAFNQAIIHRRIQLFLSDYVILKNGKVDSQTLQKEVDDLVEELYQKTEKELSEVDEYISGVDEATTLSQSYFGQLQERWKTDVDVETFKNWAKRKYALEYLTLAVSERRDKLLERGVSQIVLGVPERLLSYRASPKEISLLTTTLQYWSLLPEGVFSVEDTLLHFYITPEYIRLHIRDYGGNVESLANIVMRSWSLSLDPDRLHAVRMIVSGRMEDIRQGMELEIVRDGVVTAIEPQEALPRLKELRDALTDQYIRVHIGAILNDDIRG